MSLFGCRRRIRIVAGLILLAFGAAVHADMDWAAIAELVKTNGGSLRVLVDPDAPASKTKSLNDSARELLAYLEAQGVRVETLTIEDKNTGRTLKTFSAASLKAEESADASATDEAAGQ